MNNKLEAPLWCSNNALRCVCCIAWLVTGWAECFAPNRWRKFTEQRDCALVP